MWWLDKYGATSRTVPKYFEQNYVENFKITKNELLKCGFIDNEKVLTEKGKRILKENYKYIELHKQNWISENDRKYNIKMNNQRVEEHNKSLKKMGLGDIAMRNKASQKDMAHQFELSEMMSEAESLSKEGKIDESNNILKELVNTSFNQTQRLFWRLAVNARKLKEYDKEIEYCETFLKKYQASYGGDMHKEDFIKRLEKAKNLNGKVR